MNDHAHQRAVQLEGCFNFRDLGGYPTADGRMVRWGEVFRSDALHQLTGADIVRLRDELRIGEIVDLRSTAELQSEGRGALAREPIRFHHLPLFDGETAGRSDAAAAYDLTDRYFLLAQFAQRRIARVLTTLAAATTPAVYHCAAGKDRTGVISAIILGLLGVDDEIIAADYALTQESLDEIIQRLLATEGYRVMLEQLPPDTLHAKPQTMRAFLQRLQVEHGSMHGYARAAGVSDETIQRLQARLLVRSE
jgi:protein-tyrosine phosphatase